MGGLKKNISASITNLEQAVDKGHIDAMYTLGRIFAGDFNIDKNTREDHLPSIVCPRYDMLMRQDLFLL